MAAPNYNEILTAYQKRLQLSKDIVGYGLSFPTFFDPSSGSSTVNTDFERINQSIFTILSTARGERVMIPDFGCDLYKLVFESINNTFIQFAKTTVLQALTKWEPRIRVMDIGIYSYVNQPYSVGIKIGYEILQTKATNNYVYPYNTNRARSV